MLFGEKRRNLASVALPSGSSATLCARMGSRLPMIDLFAGAGGLSLGLCRGGFSLLDAIEQDGDACASFRSLHRGMEIGPRSIEEVSFSSYRGQVALLAGGPPCQPFSNGGKREGKSDPRDGLPEFLRAITEMQPDAVLIENVPGLLSGRRRAYFGSLIRSLRSRRYKVTWLVLNAAEYGVPQKRSRLFIVGSRRGRFAFPPPTHGGRAKRAYVRSGSVLDPAVVDGPANNSIVTYARNPDIRPSPYDGHLFNGGGRAIDLAGPAPTILASAGGNKTPFVDTAEVVPAYHEHLLAGGAPRRGQVDGARRITVNEAAALQSFPRRARFAGPRSKQYTLVGNAVPPRLACVVGRKLCRHLTGDDEASEPR
jgi:DNA (cytosine-5)-methyltransferase 1